jgi:ribosomal protein S6
MDQETQETTLYQLTILFSPSLTNKEKPSAETKEGLVDVEKNQSQLTEAKEKIKQKIVELEGIISEESSSTPILKKLAYLIKKQAEAFYFTLTFELPTQKIKELDQYLKDQKEIIRYMIKKRKEEKVKPKDSKPLDFRIVDKIEPLSDTPNPKMPPTLSDAEPTPPAAKSRKEGKERKEKIDIKELDKKLEEILNQ